MISQVFIDYYAGGHKYGMRISVALERGMRRELLAEASRLSWNARNLYKFVQQQPAPLTPRNFGELASVRTQAQIAKAIYETLK